MAESSRLFFFSLHLNSIVSMTLHLVFSEAGSANDNNSWCSLSSCTRILRVVRAVDTIDGQLSIGLISKVEGEDGLCASIHQILHWSTNSVHKMEQGSVTSSHAADLVKISSESTKSKSRHFSHLGESVICD